MKQIKIFTNSLIAIAILLMTGCTKRDLSSLQAPEFPKNGDVFIDDFTGDLAYAAFGGSDVRAFHVDTKETYGGTRQSMRFEIPDANSPQGSYAGGVFFSRTGRNLSEFTALTFYIKASQSATIGVLGYGNDLGANKFVVNLSNYQVNTNWKKVIIPIPDASKLKAEKGLFYFSAGPENNKGYTVWVDEVKFENIGTILAGNHSIMNGTNASANTYIGVNTPITGIISSFNMPNGVNQVVGLSTSFFEFKSSNPSVATVNADGVVSSISAGTATITATVGGKNATGQLSITSAGAYTNAPTPTRPAANVISIFSDAYSNIPVNYYNGYWAPWQTTLSNDFKVQNDNVLNYTNFNFVGIEFSSPTLNATSMSHIHLDAFFPNAVAPGRQLRVIVVDFGPDGAFGGTDDTRHSTTFTTPFLVSQSWRSIDISFASMTSLTRRANLGQIILEGGDGTSLFVDNIYFYNNDPSVAAPVPTRAAANVLSVFSDTYTNVANTDFNPGWGQSTAVSQISIAGNNTLRYRNLNYQGTQFASALNVSTYSNLHIDFFSLDATQLRFFLISTGPTERSVPLTVPTSAGWNSIDIPLSSFSPVNLNNVIQFKVDIGTATNGPSVFFDNIYFWR
jgi:Bacterial Ig-like domain (group 2)